MSPLVPFVSNLVKNSSRTQSFKMLENSRLAWICFKSVEIKFEFITDFFFQLVQYSQYMQYCLFCKFFQFVQLCQFTSSVSSFMNSRTFMTFMTFLNAMIILWIEFYESYDLWFDEFDCFNVLCFLQALAETHSLKEGLSCPQAFSTSGLKKKRIRISNKHTQKRTLSLVKINILCIIWNYYFQHR